MLINKRMGNSTVWQLANRKNSIQGMNQGDLKISGYVRSACNLACDNEVFDKPGNCPFCLMPLVPRLKKKE